MSNMRRQSLSAKLGSIERGEGTSGEPLIVVEESSLGEEEAERKRNESPPRCLDPDSPSLDPFLLSPWRDTRKHSLPTPQCTSGITASQVRRLSERGGEGSGPSPREAAFLATLSQAPAPQPGGRRHSVVTISRVPTTLFGRNNRRESIAAFPLAGGAPRILQSRRDSASSAISGPPSNRGSSHNLQLDIMDDIAEVKARKVRLKMWKTPSRERVCEVQPLEGNTNATAQRYTQYQKRRYSEFPVGSATSPLSGHSLSGSLRRRASEVSAMKKPPLPDNVVPSGSGGRSTGIVCSNTDLISILSSLTSSATEINTCGVDESSSSSGASKEESKTAWSMKTTEQKRNRLKSFRSNSFDVSILHGTGTKQTGNAASGSKITAASIMAPSNWFAKRHQPMSKKQRAEDVVDKLASTLSFKLDKTKIVKTVKDTFSKTSPTKEADFRHKGVWDDSSGTKVDAQILGSVVGSAIEKILTAQKCSDSEAAGSSKLLPSVSPNKPKTGKLVPEAGGSSKIIPSLSPNKPKSSKVSSWFSAGNKDQEQTESCETSICSSLKDLFVK